MGDGGGSSFLGFKFSGSGANIDEKTLQDIADETGGKYFFRAKDTGDLVRIYETINELEKLEAEYTKYLETLRKNIRNISLLGLIFGGGLFGLGVFSYRRFP